MRGGVKCVCVDERKFGGVLVMNLGCEMNLAEVVKVVFFVYRFFFTSLHFIRG